MAAPAPVKALAQEKLVSFTTTRTAGGVGWAATGATPLVASTQYSPVAEFLL